MIARLLARLRTRTTWRCPWCSAYMVERTATAAERKHRDYCPRKDIR
ncbi:hypothetical protein M3G03_10125 [Aestuariimicrobium sp. p3-SID1156]|nr:hypothetical protein [Aestuariimicrobium sp. p3-SID1156]MCT1459887.1 hypothetical protein [Aestuariimicrobium sp. p3-SID1156]